ncbi:MAG: hypothetical protein Q4C96_04495, partial [Planctomycetia bacterium]|nr:hypothetical protein [Planctomycetia bacterium]
QRSKKAGEAEFYNVSGIKGVFLRIGMRKMCRYVRTEKNWKIFSEEGMFFVEHPLKNFRGQL